MWDDTGATALWTLMAKRRSRKDWRLTQRTSSFTFTFRIRVEPSLSVLNSLKPLKPIAEGPTLTTSTFTCDFRKRKWITDFGMVDSSLKRSASSDARTFRRSGSAAHLAWMRPSTESSQDINKWPTQQLVKKICWQMATNLVCLHNSTRSSDISIPSK